MPFVPNEAEEVESGEAQREEAEFFMRPPYFPSINQRPDDALFDIFKTSLDSPNPEIISQSPAFIMGMRALKRGYYWEAHELFEAVWMALRPNSLENILLKALIQLANASLKQKMGNPRAAQKIIALANEARNNLKIGAVKTGYDMNHTRIMGISMTKIDALFASIIEKEAI